MSFNFPNSPSSGQTYTPAGGPVFTWDGIAWRSYVQDVPITVYVSDTAPVGPTIGQLWWESDTGNMFIWYNDPDGSQWVQVSGSVSATPTAETRNRIVNPAMQISQENGNTAGNAQGYFAADQWMYGCAGTVIPMTQRVQSVTLNGSKDRYRITINTADAALAAGDYLESFQPVEGIRVSDFRWGTASAKQAILRFGWRSPAGTYSIALGNGTSPATRVYLANFTISAGQANTDTEQVIVIPGDTTGTWATDTSAGMRLQFCIAAGTTFQGVAGWNAGNFLGTAANTNGLATAGAVFELFDVGLYLDPLGTGVPPRWQMPDEAEELQACKRYWEKTGAYGCLFMGNVTTGVGYTNGGRWQVQKRATPAVTGINFTGNGFPNAVGTFSGGVDDYYENRVASGTMSAAFFHSYVIGNARM